MVLEQIRDVLLGILAFAVLLTPLWGVAILRGWRWDWQCGWVLGLLALGVGAGVASHSFFGILLLGVVSLLFERQRRGLATPLLWRLRLARALAGAALFTALGLVSLAVVVRSGLSRWSGPVEWAGLLFASAAVTALLLRRGGREAALGDREPVEGRPGFLIRFAQGLGAVLLVGCLTAALSIPWGFIHAQGGQFLFYLDSGGFIGYAGGGCLLSSPREVAMMGLDLSAGTALLLWGFQHLWARVMADPGRG